MNYRFNNEKRNGHSLCETLAHDPFYVRLGVILFCLFSFWSYMDVCAQTDVPLDSVVTVELKTGEKVKEGHYGEMEDYRRSSLAIIMVTHRGTKYAQEMEQEFMNMSLPPRYNDHNINIRVLPVSGSMNAKKITKLLADKDVARQLVARWFNRDNDGKMNMDLIHQRGGYSATHEDFVMSEYTERGRALLTDEGIELLKNTFVLVCDMDYYDRANTGQALGALFAVAAAGAQVYANEQARKGNTDKAYTASAFAGLSAVGSVASQEIAGFSVKMRAYLYRLQWDQQLTQKMYGEYWIDDDTQSDIAQRKVAFENDNQSFQLNYIGAYYAKSGKTVAKSASDLHQVIRDVCSKTISKGMINLSKMFPVFKPKTRYQCSDERTLSAYIGTKEGVSNKQKFEILETVKDKKGVYSYKKVGSAVATNVWNNVDHNYVTDGEDCSSSGSTFRLKSGKNLCGADYVMRESGTLGYQFKRKNSFFIDLQFANMKLDEEKAREDIYSGSSSTISFNSDQSRPSFGYRMGWLLNYSQVFGWNVINMDMTGGNSTLFMGFNTGVILRTPTFWKSNTSLFLWPTVGWAMSQVHYEYTKSTTTSTYHKGYRDSWGRWHSGYYTYNTKYSNHDGTQDLFGFDWQVRFGININPHLHLGASVGNYQSFGLFVGWQF